MVRKEKSYARRICKNPSTAVQRIFAGFYMLGQRFLAIISLRARTKIGTFLLTQS
jgi:hypothetical protein